MSDFIDDIRQDRKADFQRILKLHETETGKTPTGRTLLELKTSFVAQSLIMFVEQWRELAIDDKTDRNMKIEIALIIQRLDRATSRMVAQEKLPLNTRTNNLLELLRAAQIPTEPEKLLLKLGSGSAVQTSIMIAKVLEDILNDPINNETLDGE